MKILLSKGFEKIYQIGSCFRADEYGRKHREEFTMLEFYQVGIDYMELLKIDSNPRIQLEPLGTRGYIELLPVKGI